MCTLLCWIPKHISWRSIDPWTNGRTEEKERKKENTLVAYRPLSSLLRVAAVVVVVAIVVRDEEKLRLNSCCYRTLLLFYSFIYLKFSIWFILSFTFYCTDRMNLHPFIDFIEPQFHFSLTYSRIDSTQRFTCTWRISLQHSDLVIFCNIF